MATKSKQQKPEDQPVEETREGSVQEAPEATFDERTKVTQPWKNEDGSENRGDVPSGEATIEGEDTPEEPTE